MWCLKTDASKWFIRVNPREIRGQGLRAYQRSDFLADDDFPDIPAVVEIENDDGQVIVFAQRNGG